MERSLSLMPLNSCCRRREVSGNRLGDSRARHPTFNLTLSEICQTNVTYAVTVIDRHKQMLSTGRT